MTKALKTPILQNERARQSALIRIIDICLSSMAILILLPLWCLNILLALFCYQYPFEIQLKYDVLKRENYLVKFSKGYLKHSLVLLQVIKGDIALCGLPLHEGENEFISNFKYQKAGLINVYNLRKMSGLSQIPLEETLKTQCNYNAFTYLFLVLRFLICTVLYRSNNLVSTNTISLFGVHLDNVSMKDAVNMVINSKNVIGTKVGYFVNVNSINLFKYNESLAHNINLGDMVFADGSGVRLAARCKGCALKDNINGTDLLPLLCEESIKRKKKIFLLGAEPGLAKTAAKNLKHTHQGLQIVGTHHGYFDKKNSQKIIKVINESQANILLVGLGSPYQEHWIEENREFLNVDITLAVGGLFDFYSGKIPRAPLWLREIGMEWVWRLAQEPKSKFKRYVIGNPIFLLRILMNPKGV